jgi:hypothetical protein
MSHPITDKRGKVVHYSNGSGKPLCRPHTRVTFNATLIGRDVTLCKTCSERDLRARYENGEQ